MRSRAAFIIARTRQRIADACTITIRWTALSGGTADPLTGSLVDATPTSKSTTIKGLVHYVAPATTGFRVYNEIELGDAIVDIDPNTVIADNEDLNFEIDSVQWVQKEVGKKLAQSWDVFWTDQRISRTLLLTRKK